MHTLLERHTADTTHTDMHNGAFRETDYIRYEHYICNGKQNLDRCVLSDLGTHTLGIDS